MTNLSAQTLTRTPDDATGLPEMIRRAADALAGAETAAEVLDARDTAGLVYDAAKRAARMQKAKGAHDSVVAATHRAQADALEIESRAKRRLADEYDAAQERGEVAKPGGDRSKLPNEKFDPASPKDLGLNDKQIHEARRIRDAEAADPGIVRRTVDRLVESGDEPTRAAVRRAVHADKPKAEPMPEPAAPAETIDDNLPYRSRARDGRAIDLTAAATAPVASRRKAKPAEPLSAVGKNPARIERMRINAEIWGRVRDALTHLTNLPRPADVAVIARGFDKNGMVDERLARSVNWLKEFENEWNDRD